MADLSDHAPSASLRRLQQRARLLGWLRRFFESHGYWEVQTPVLSHDVCVDAWLEPIAVPLAEEHQTAPAMAYLQTSPEFAMKRLLAAGADAIYQIAPAFRRGESGPLHNPEFTMLEWYRVGASYHDQMAFTEELVAGFLRQAGHESGQVAEDASVPDEWQLPFKRQSYTEAFQTCLDIDPHTLSGARLREVAAEANVTAPASMSDDDRDGWLNLLLAEIVEPRLAHSPALFLYDYPASQAALARIRTSTPPVAERFELYLRGIEICNGYQELTDADELRRRIRRQSQLRQQAGLRPLSEQSRLLSAMEAGLPDCSGVALGFDRLLMVALQQNTMADVVAFPWERA